jgi:type I restriction enzyme, S subunit
MEFATIPPSQLERASLKAEFYGRDFRAVSQLLRQQPTRMTLEQIRCPQNPIRRGIDMPQFVTTGYSPILVTIASFSDPGIEFENLERIDEAQHRKFHGSQLKTGDLLVAMGGYVGAAAIVPPNCPAANIGRHTARIVVDSQKADKHFVWAYIRSSIGTRLFEREVTGSVQAGINLEDLREIEIPIPAGLVQRYIGNKVRRAERLRAYSQALDANLEADINGLFSNEVRVAINYDANNVKYSRVDRSLLTDRLDSRYYSPSFVRLSKELREHPSLAEITSKIECGPFGGNAIADDLYEADGLPFIRPLNLTGSRFDQSKLVLVSSKRLKQFGLKEYEGENLFFARVGSPAVAYFSGAASISPNVIIARGDSSKADVAYLQCFCSSKFGLMQLEQELKEGVQPTTSTDAVRNLKVVLPSQSQQIHIGNRHRTSERFRQISECLITASKSLVEAIIERKVSEDELINAQSRLELGDDSADRAILSRLFEGGWNATETRPLFPDLDADYETLRMVEREPTEVAAK